MPDSQEQKLNDPTTLQELEQLLQEEIRQYESTIEKLNLKKEVIVVGHPKKLAAVDQELLALSRKATQLEKQRKQLLTSMGRPNYTLSQLITQLEPKHTAQFTLLRDRLSRAVLDTQKLNGETRDLLNLSLQWLHETVEIIASAINPEGASYTAQGNNAAQRNATTKATIMKSTISHSA